MSKEEVKRKSPTEDLDNNFNVYAGSGRGYLRGVKFGPDLPVTKTYPKGMVDKLHPVVCLAWVDETEKEVLVGISNHVVKIYDIKLKAYTQIISLDVEETKPMVSLFQYKENFLCGFESGRVSLWNFLSSTSVLNIKTGNHLAKVKQCETDSKYFATGGEKNNLKVWDIENSTEPIFAAKHLPNDELELEVPIWVQDMTFMPQSTEILYACSRYGEIMMYDIRADTKKRPVTYMKYYDHACISISNTMLNSQVLVGSAKGQVSLIDFRNPGKGQCARAYKGFVGSIRSIVSIPTSPYFLSSGLDSHLYLHDIKQRQPIKKLWLKDRINCLLMTKDFSLTDPLDAEHAKSEVLVDHAIIKCRENVSPKKLKMSKT